MKTLRIERKTLESGTMGIDTTYINVWHLQEKVRVHHWPWPKTWITRSIHQDPSSALLAYGELLLED